MTLQNSKPPRQTAGSTLQLTRGLTDPRATVPYESRLLLDMTCPLVKTTVKLKRASVLAGSTNVTS